MVRLIGIAVMTSSWLSAMPALARPTAPAPSPVVNRCLQLAATKHSVDYRLLRAIAHQESHFNPSAVRKPGVAGNSDGSTDYGLMQINSSWLGTLKKHGITQASLLEPCTNADVGAWILASNFARMGVTWNAVGAYNAVTPWKRVRYANGVYGKLLKQNTPVTAQATQHSDQTANNKQSTETVRASQMASYEEVQP